jgi:hypothetical protein
LRREAGGGRRLPRVLVIVLPLDDSCASCFFHKECTIFIKDFKLEPLYSKIDTISSLPEQEEI